MEVSIDYANNNLIELNAIDCENKEKAMEIVSIISALMPLKDCVNLLMHHKCHEEMEDGVRSIRQVIYAQSEVTKINITCVNELQNLTIEFVKVRTDHEQTAWVEIMAPFTKNYVFHT